jgi:hypothetical protein
MVEKINYNKTSVYESQIVPLLSEITTICEKEKIPFFFSAAVKNTDKETIYRDVTDGTIAMGVLLNDDRIVEYLKIAAGYEVILPDVIPDIELGN